MFCFELALLDYRMSPLSGPEVAQKMKSMRPNVPIMMIPGCAVLPDTELLFVDAHFGSDSSLDDLMAAMRTLAGSQAVERNQAVACDWCAGAAPEDFKYWNTWHRIRRFRFAPSM
jgi:hypothetical protein